MAPGNLTMGASAPRRSGWHRWLWLGIGLGVLALVYVADPATAGFYPRCPYRLLTGWRCPGCGTGRALHQLLHAHLAAAWSLNPAAVIGLPLFGIWLALDLWRRRTGRDLLRRLPRLTGWVVVVLIVAWWILRNALGLTTA